MRGFFSFPHPYFENFITDDLNTLADGPRKGKATPEDAPGPPVGRQQEKRNHSLFCSLVSFCSYQRRPNKVQSGTHPTGKQAVAACLAIIPPAYIDTSVQSQPPLTGGSRNEGSRQRSWRGWDSHDAVKPTAVQAIAFVVQGLYALHSALGE